MRFILLCCTVFVLLKSIEADSVFEKAFKGLHHEPPPPVPKEKANVQTKWIEQQLDHFNESDSRTWRMRYMVNTDHFKSGAPMFIFVGGEWAISPGFVQGGHMFDMGKELNGYLIYTEHRFYGESQPFEDLAVENLKYLNVNQSLADLAYFIKTTKNTISELKDSKVILVGGSYSATMVTWFKRIYPDLANVSWGSSAPLLAKVDFIEYKEVAGQSIKLVGGQKCYDRIHRGVAELESMLTSNKAEEFRKFFNLCDNFDISNELNVWTLFQSLSTLFAGIVQGHNAGNIEKMCEIILEPENDTSGVRAWLFHALGCSHSCECFDFAYSAWLKELSKMNETNKIMRQWTYQTCNEFGWYQSSGSKDQPFGTKFPVDLSINLCRDVYGEQFSNTTIYDNVIRTNYNFGGLTPNVSNVVLTHGQLDPWSAIGIHEHENGKSNVIPLYSHCQDLGSISEMDTVEMKASKGFVKKYIYKSIGINSD